MAENYFDNKFFQFEDFYSVFSTVTAVSRLIALKKRSGDYISDDESSDEVNYSAVKYDDEFLLKDDILYFHLLSAAFCCDLRSEFSGYDIAEKELDRYLFDDLLDGTEPYSDEESDEASVPSLIHDIWNSISRGINDLLSDKDNGHIWHYWTVIRRYFRRPHDSADIRYELMLLYNRIVHDNIMCCMVNKGETAVERILTERLNKIIEAVTDDDIKRLIDKVITRRYKNGKWKKQSMKKLRSCCLAETDSGSDTGYYFSISGFSERIAIDDKKVKELLQKPALQMSKADEKTMELINGIATENKWKYCSLETFTESFYYDNDTATSFAEYFTNNKETDKECFKAYLHEKPICFIEFLEVMEKKGLLDNNDNNFGRIFSCVERKIISCIKNEGNIPKTARFYVYRKPCFICQESLDNFKRDLDLKDIHVWYADNE